MGKMKKYYENIHSREYQSAYNCEPANSTDLICSGRPNNQSLDGAWKFTPDVFNSLLRKQLFDFSKSKDREGRNLPVDFIYGQGIDINVPGTWNASLPELSLYEGTGIYTKQFDYCFPPNTCKVFIRIGAANYETKIFLNGKYIGRHIGGFTPFCLDITDAIIEKENQLLVLVDNTRKFEQIPSETMIGLTMEGLQGPLMLFPCQRPTLRVFMPILFLIVISKRYVSLQGLKEKKRNVLSQFPN